MIKHQSRAICTAQGQKKLSDFSVESGNEIRLATLADLPALCTIEQACFPIEKYGRDVLDARRFSYLLKRGNSLIIVCEKDGIVVGYAVLFFRANSSNARIYSLAVAPDYQGQGISAALIKASADLCRKLALISIIQEIRADNESLYKRYARQGWKVYKREDNYYSDGMAAIKLRFSLGG